LRGIDQQFDRSLTKLNPSHANVDQTVGNRMNEQFFTEGAKRALRMACELANDHLASEVEPLHLLWALTLEESQAAEILAQKGISCSSLQILRPLDSDSASTALPDVSRPSGTVLASDELIGRKPAQFSDALEDVLLQAGQQTTLDGRYSELSTEHLLWGLAAVDSAAADTLQQHGLGTDVLGDQESTFRNGPLEVDFTINWNKQTGTNQTDCFRIIDAAANRAREGLRVLEDFSRFAVDDAHLTDVLKNCRHMLTDILKPLGATALLKARDTEEDVGTEISVPTETTRSSLSDVVLANFKRVQEATRTLEEFVKFVSPHPVDCSDGNAAWADRLKQLRYQLYTLEKGLLSTLVNRRQFEGRNLYLLVTESLCRQDFEQVVCESLAAGVGVIQLREKSLSDRRLIDRAKRVRQWTREGGALYIMNDRPDLAVLTEADGVHIGQDELTVRQVRRIVGPNGLIGISTHTIEQARKAVLDGADYIGVGPVFPSMTKEIGERVDRDFVRQVAAEIALPWFAIGGIDTANVDQVHSVGATHVAVCSVICNAEHPGQIARSLLNHLLHGRQFGC